MAMADYRLCDVCGEKAFYDARLNYDDWQDSDLAERPNPFRFAGNEQYDEQELLDHYGVRLDYLGDWAVICEDCAKTHKCVIVPIDSTSASISLT